MEGAGQWPDVDVFFSPGVSDVPNVDAGVVRDKMRGEASEARLITLVLTSRSSAAEGEYRTMIHNTRTI